jgi:hypothetical protein
MSLKTDGRDTAYQRSWQATSLQAPHSDWRMRRGREKRRRQEMLSPVAATESSMPQINQLDPVQIAILAMGSVARASMRACFDGTEIKVAVPDEAIAAVFREALNQTGRARPTDRLIRIVVDEPVS